MHKMISSQQKTNEDSPIKNKNSSGSLATRLSKEQMTSEVVAEIGKRVSKRG